MYTPVRAQYESTLDSAARCLIYAANAAADLEHEQAVERLYTAIRLIGDLQEESIGRRRIRSNPSVRAA